MLLSMDVPESEVPVYAGWADSAISVTIIACLPLVSIFCATASIPATELNLQHVRLIRHYPHRPLLVITLLLSGGIAALIGFCTSPWQLVRYAA